MRLSPSAQLATFLVIMVAVACLVSVLAAIAGKHLPTPVAVANRHIELIGCSDSRGRTWKPRSNWCYLEDAPP